MKIPRVFFYFLGIAQVILFGAHALLAVAVLFFFPSLRSHTLAIWLFFAVAGGSFLLFSILDWKSENKFLRWGYILSGVWLPIWFFALIAAALSSLLYLAVPSQVSILAPLLFIIAIGLSIYGVVNAAVLRTEKISVTLPHLPEYWKGKTAILVTDMHLGHVLRHSFARKIISRLNQLRPEIVFMSGDFYDGVKTNFTSLAQEFKALQVPQGVYFVTGNHEEFAGYKNCEEAITGSGIKILENEKVELEGLQVAGLAYFPEGQETDRRVGELIGKLHIDPNKPSILLKHVPNKARLLASLGIHLQLSGHTHHGQIWPVRFITRRVYKGFDYGLKQIGSKYIYTSGGAGTWGPPVRIFTKSEIVEITFI